MKPTTTMEETVSPEISDSGATTEVTQSSAKRLGSTVISAMLAAVTIILVQAAVDTGKNAFTKKSREEAAAKAKAEAEATRIANEQRFASSIAVQVAKEIRSTPDQTLGRILEVLEKSLETARQTNTEIKQMPGVLRNEVITALKDPATGIRVAIAA